MTFAAPWFLLGTLLAGLVGLVLLLGGLGRARAVARFGDPGRVTALVTADPSKRRAWKGVLLVIATALAFVAAARPQYGKGTRLIPATNVDVVVVLDYSKSMYARDVEPSRIFRAKVEMARLVKELEGARFAAVAFAGEPMGFPLTADGPAIAQFLRQLEPNDMPVGGTAIARALDHARDMLLRDPKSAEHKRIVVLVTDGEDLEGDPVQIAQGMGAEGTTVHVVQIGGRTPERIPEIGNNGEITGWRLDKKGKPLTTALSAAGEQQLAAIAAATPGGQLVRSDKGKTGIETISAELKKQMKTEYGEKVETVYADVYFYPLGLAILLLLAEVFLGDAPRRVFERRAPPSAPTRPTAPQALPPRPAARPRVSGPPPAPPPKLSPGAAAGVLAFLVTCACGGATWLSTGCSGWDPLSPFERNSPDVDRALSELDAGAFRSAEDILEEYLATGPCSDAGIGVPDSVKQKHGGGFDLGLTLFYLAESFGQPFGQEEEGLDGPGRKRQARLRGLEINCALLVTLAIANDPNVPIELRARAHYLAGNLEFLRRRYEDAIEHYDEALKLVPGILEEAGGDEIGRDAAWNRAIALRRIPLIPLEEREVDGGDGEDAADGADGGDGEDGADGNDAGDADGDAPDEAGDAADGGDGNDGDSGNEPDGGEDGGPGDGSDQSDATDDAPGDAPGDVGEDGSEPEPVPVGEPMPATPDPTSDNRILDQLEEAPTYQEQEAKNRGNQRRGRTMEDK